MFYLDPLYLVFVLPALLLAFWAQMRVRSAYKKYLRVPNARGMTGLEAAQHLLQSQGLGDIQIEGIPGELSDNYDPRNKTLHLSQGVANGRSVASLGIVAHEVGHAVQDQTGYGPMRLRAGIVPMVQVGAWLGPIIFFVGLVLFNSPDLATVGLILFSLSAVFALLTLPVELNASHRALQMLTTDGLVIDAQEAAGARQVLNAAAWTYVAALVQVLATLLYYVSVLGGFGGRRRR
jgi:Zn-dependent membrane protease YugP